MNNMFLVRVPTKAVTCRNTQVVALDLRIKHHHVIKLLRLKGMKSRLILLSLEEQYTTSQVIKINLKERLILTMFKKMGRGG